MRISIDKIKFESRCDIIDYVTKGFLPSKKEFDKLIKMLMEVKDCLDDYEYGYNVDETSSIDSDIANITQCFETSNQVSAYIEILESVYTKRKNLQDKIIIGSLTALSTVVFAVISSTSKNKTNALINDNENRTEDLNSSNIIHDDVTFVVYEDTKIL